MDSPASESVTVLPGVPNMAGLTVDDGAVPYVEFGVFGHVGRP